VSDEQTPLDLDKLAKICALFSSDFPDDIRRDDDTLFADEDGNG
jgi:hypothetical protein